MDGLICLQSNSQVRSPLFLIRYLKGKGQMIVRGLLVDAALLRDT